jgi:Na+/H+ antiporter NhaD/arsenite permease-like protein
VWGKVHRFIPAVIAAGTVLLVLFIGIMHSPHSALEALNLGQLTHLKFWMPGHEQAEASAGVNWQTIIFITGMMIMVEGMAKAGLFRWLCLVVARAVKYRVVPILVAFTLLAGFLAMFVDSITVLLFLAAVTIELSRLLKFDPVPLIISEIFAANVGGAASMCGDPPNIIIGTAFGFTFTDFLANTGPIALIALVAATLFFYLVFRKQLAKSDGQADAAASCPQPGEAISNMRYFIVSAVIFLVTVSLLVSHAATGMSVGLIGAIAAVLTLAVSGRNWREILSKVDWKTLAFFIGLFIVVSGLETTGVLEMLAGLIGSISGGSTVFVIVVILWFSALASALVDNIPFAATMVPVVRDLAAMQGIDLATLSWALALGTDIGGNGTPIGASANVVGTAIAEKEGHPVSWGRFMKYAVPATVFVVGLCMLYLLVRY